MEKLYNMENTELTTQDDNLNIDDLLALTGSVSYNRGPDICRVNLVQSPIKGTAEVKGKPTTIEIVPVGWFAIKLTDRDTPLYVSQITIRPFMQRSSLTRYDGNAEGADRFIKTVYDIDVYNKDLKDTDGTFNCGKPSEFIEDWESLPASLQKVIKACKNTLTTWGTIESVEGLMDEDENEVDLSEVVGKPVEIVTANRDSVRKMRKEFGKFAQKRVAPMQHPMVFVGLTQAKQDGSDFAYLDAHIDFTEKLDLDRAHVETLKEFNDYVGAINKWVVSKWTDKNFGDDADKELEVPNEFLEVSVEED